MTKLLTDDEIFGAPATGNLLSDEDLFGGGQAAPTKPRSVADIARDVGVTALKSTVSLPQAVVGLVDIPAGGRVGKALEEVGYRPNESQQMLDDLYSEQTRADKRYVAQADGFVDTLGRAIERPATIATAVGESLSSMLGGAGIARGAIKLLPKLAPVIAGAIGEGAITAGQTAEQIRADNKDGLLTPMQSAAATGAGAVTGVLGFVGGKLSQRFGIGDIDTILASQTGQATTKGFVRQMVEAGVSEGLFEEMPQSAQEQMWQNFATGKPLMDGVGNQAAMGLITGAAMGAGGGGYNAVLNAKGQAIDKPADTPIADAMLGHASMAPPAASASDVLGVPQDDQKKTEAEQALYEPKSITALDRVSEIDKEIQTADPAKAVELQTERDNITRTWPKAVPGAETSFSTEAGARVDAQYALMEAGDLNTSHDENLRANPAYPQELQPRQRDRAASEMQVSSIVQRLDPARLGESADAANGAPIVGADGLVESGNARTIALKRVYGANGAKADAYKQFLTDNAERFGISPESVQVMKSPVLVRVRTTPVNRAEFARQANASTVAMMSPSEQAKSDAARIDDMADLMPDDSGDFTNADSRGFVRRFMAKLPGTEQAGMIDANGALSQTGYARIRNAVLAKAYGDSPVLMRMVESMDDNLRNVSKALMKVAPQVAKARQGIAEGALHDADVTPDLMAAVTELSRIKDEGKSVKDALAQQGMFGGYSEETRQILSFLDENIRRPRRMAEFVQRYFEALEAAGNPNQGSLLGDNAAPGKQDLLNVARRINDVAEDTQRADAGKDQGAGQATGNQPADAQRNAGSAQSHEAAGSEWVDFPPDSGTLGIPRAEMPQVKGEHRGALVNFLKGRGIEGEKSDVPALDLKPTQQEFSLKKAARWRDVAPGTDRSVLTSSDGYILDGHHQWVAALASNEPIQQIRFNAPIRELLDAVFEFPSVKRSEGAQVIDFRAIARQDFKDALADLAQIMSKHTRAAMVPENTPDLMPTLVRLFDAGLREVGYSLKDLVAYVKKALRADPAFKKDWNKISDATLRKAAQQAIDEFVPDEQRQRGLFDQPAAKEVKRGESLELFNQPQGAKDGQGQKAEVLSEEPAVAMIDGRPFDPSRDNWSWPKPESFMPIDSVSRAKRLIAEFSKEAVDPEISKSDREAAEALLNPLLDKANKVSVQYNQAIIDIAKSLGMPFMIGPVKKLDRSIIKLATDTDRNQDGSMDVGQMRDILRSTIVVNQYADAQRVVDEIYKRFTVEKGRIKNRTDATISAPDLKGKTGFLPSGYGDVLINVEIGGVKAEIQINIPEMISAKMEEGHKLYEIERDAQKGSDLEGRVIAAQAEYYSLASEANDLASAKNDSSSIMSPRVGRQGAGISEDPSFDRPKTEPLGNSTLGESPSLLTANRQPAGNLSGTFISSTSTDSVSEQGVASYTKGEKNASGVANDQHGKPGDGGAQGEVAGTASRSDGKRETEGVRQGSSRANRLGSGQPDATGSGKEQVGSAGSGRVRGENEDGRSAQPGNRSGRPAGIPASPDIPVKTGRNYSFGENDLTYEGSWLVKARQNVEALELLKTLEQEGRQATREEQAVLAKFIGWGSSEIANSIFGASLDKKLSAIASFDRVIDSFDRLKRDRLSKGGRWRGDYADSGYYEAASMLRDAGKLGPHEYPAEITREQVNAVRPDMAAKKWAELRDRVKKTLTPEEWNEASRSTQYAHYTSKPIVNSMMAAIQRMGFKGGSIIEPGAGIGVFPGLMPAEMATNSVYTGVEFEPITGGILKQLFPDERILVESFVDTALPANYYDIGFGNPPFGNIPILADPKYRKFGFSLHDYFFAKTMDSVKPGGLVVFVTSRYTMDKLDDKARAYLADRADLVGAIRLPQTAFKKNAGTDVVTDVLFLRKKVQGETFDHGQPWAASVPLKINGRSYPINEYFHAHPEMVLGKNSDAGKMANSPDPQYTVEATDGDIEALFDKAAQSLPADVFRADRGTASEAAKVRELDFNPKAQKEGNYYVSDGGALMVREGGVGMPVEGMTPKDAAMVKDFVGLRDALKQAHYDQLNNGDWESSLASLRKVYSSFTAKHGQINQFTTYMQKVKVDELNDEGEPTGQKVWDEEQRYRYPLLNKIKDDPDWTLVAALEKINEETGEIQESAFLNERVLGKPETVQAQTPTDAMLQVLNDTGKVDVGMIADRLGLSESEAIEALGPLIYSDPSAGWVTADEYLSGDVRKKLKAAEAAAKTDKRYQRNVEALISVMPPNKTHSEITPQIGMPWIPTDIYEQFLRDKADISTTVSYNERTGQWNVGVDDSSYTKSFADRRSKRKGELSDAATKDWGTDRRNAAEIFEYALTGAPVRIMSKQGIGSDAKDVFDPVATEAVTEKLNQMREAFKSWLWEDQARIDKLVPIYNDKFNTIVPRKFDGSHMTLPGTSKRWDVFGHVKRGAWRIVQAGNTYLAHAVGSGKTFQMIISAMEQKRLGLIKKPAMVVPNHMLQQFAREWQDLYPAARLMVADEANFTGDNRRRFVSRVALSDLDGVIITHSAFKLLDLDPEFKQRMIQEELDYLRAALKEAGGEEGEKGKSRDPKVKQIEKRIERMEQKLEAAMSATGKDKNVRFDETGIDMLYVDEAHEYRKLAFTTQRQVKGIDPNGSDKAFDLHMKVQWLRENKNPTRNLVMASGTPVTNTLAELYTVQRFMAPQVLAERGLDEFDQWASMFGAESTSIEPDASGKYGPVTRFNKFVNVSELTQMFRDFADVLTSDYLASLLGDKRPKVKGGSRVINVTPKTDEYAAFQKEELQPRMEASRKWKPSRDEPNNPDPIIKIIGDGRLAAIDMRFIEPGLPSNPDSKLNQMIDNVINVYKETGGYEYREKSTKDKDGNEVLGKSEKTKGATQIVFSDLGFGAGVTENRGFNARAWFEKRLRDAGVPPSQIAFMSDYKKSAAKLQLFKDINAGRVRIVVGSSKNMGTGVNAQQRLIALHHLDSPWYPADLEQREGRIVRQGNKNPEVQLYAYATKGSYDEQMWSTLARKQFFIDQALSGDPNIREIEDLGESSQFDIAAAMVADDPRVLQLAGLKAEIDKLNRLYMAHDDQRGKMQRDYDTAGARIQWAEKEMAGASADAAKVQDLSGDKFKAKSEGKTFDNRKEWGQSLLAQFKELSDRLVEKDTVVGNISGFDVVYRGFGKDQKRFMAELAIDSGDGIVIAQESSTDPVSLALRANSALVAIARRTAELRTVIDESKAKRNALESRIGAQFPMYQMLLDKQSEAQKLEEAIVASSNALSGLEREQQLEDEWQQKTGAITPLFSRGGGKGMAYRDLKAVAARVEKGFKNLPRVNVLESPEQAPESLREHIRKAGAWDDVEGAMHEGEIYLFASGLADEARAEHVLATHEVTHYGLRGAIGKGLDAALQHVWMNNANIRKAASKIKARDGLASNVEAVEEVLAEMPSVELVQLKGWRRVVQVVRDWLRRSGADSLASRLDAWMKSGLSEQEQADLFVSDLVGSARQWVKTGKTNGAPLVDETRLSRSSQTANQTAAERADEIIQAPAATWRPVDAIMRGLTHATRFDNATAFLYDKAAQLIRYTPEQIKAGVVSDYGVPEAVIDRRVQAQGRMRVQMRKTGELVEKLATLTRAESRVAYEWMNNNDPQALKYFEAQLPEESIKVMEEVKGLIDQLSQEAVSLGQLNEDAFKHNRFEYLRRSYVKHTAELTKGETDARRRAISILGDQYKGRGMTDSVDMAKFKNVAPEWWGRKLKEGQADKGLKGEKFIRLERRKADGAGVMPLEQHAGPGDTNPKKTGKLLEVVYWPAGEALPAKFADWENAGTWEVRDTKGKNLIVWRDFTKQERIAMGEIDEARYAIAKTLHGMIHDVETGRYLDWLATTYAKKPGEAIDGEIIEASERMRDTFKPGTWVQVPETKIPGTSVVKYGKLAGRYIPGPIWNDVRQTVGFRFKPLGETYAAILGAWKTAKTALSPAVHTNNVMANFVMADWHDVTAGHVLKALRILLGASQRDGKGLIGRAGNLAARAGRSDTDAVREVLNRYQDSGGNIGTWAVTELQKDQLEPLLAAMEKELGLAGETAGGQVGVWVALQKALQLRLPSAWEAFKPSLPGRVATTEARNLISLYEAEDQVFRLAAWLKSKEDGASDIEAGKVARKSFLDYHINAPWIQAMRSTAFPFVSFTYRSVPMLIEVAAKKPHKLMKLALAAAAVNALGYMMSGGDEDDERKLLPEEKAGKILGLVPKLVRMPWNDKFDDPVFLDIRRFVPVGDIFDTGSTNSAMPILPAMVPGGPLAILAELALNKTQFTGKPITLETDSPDEKAVKIADYLYKSLMPNVPVVPGTYSWTGIANASKGKTDAFGRELSTPQAVASAFGVKLGSYPKDVLMQNLKMKEQADLMEVQKNIRQLKREHQRNGIDDAEFEKKMAAQVAKQVQIKQDFQKRINGR